MDRLRFGTFLAPFHPAGENPTLAIQRDLELVEHLDRLGYDEAWIGEHHSAGTELIASPEIFIAAAAAVASPTGPRMAGQHGVGLLSIGATLTKEGFDALAHHWSVVEERAAHYGRTANRRDWRLVGLMHIAETREQAYRDVEYGIETWFRYFQKVAAFPQMAVAGGDIKEM